MGAHARSRPLDSAPDAIFRSDDGAGAVSPSRHRPFENQEHVSTRGHLSLRSGKAAGGCIDPTELEAESGRSHCLQARAQESLRTGRSTASISEAVARSSSAHHVVSVQRILHGRPSAVVLAPNPTTAKRAAGGGAAVRDESTSSAAGVTAVADFSERRRSCGTPSEPGRPTESHRWCDAGTAAGCGAQRPCSRCSAEPRGQWSRLPL
jgi:hypothetical protein